MKKAPAAKLAAGAIMTTVVFDINQHARREHFAGSQPIQQFQPSQQKSILVRESGP